MPLPVSKSFLPQKKKGEVHWGGGRRWLSPVVEKEERPPKKRKRKES